MENFLLETCLNACPDMADEDAVYDWLTIWGPRLATDADATFALASRVFAAAGSDGDGSGKNLGVMRLSVDGKPAIDRPEPPLL